MGRHPPEKRAHRDDAEQPILVPEVQEFIEPFPPTELEIIARAPAEQRGLHRERACPEEPLRPAMVENQLPAAPPADQGVDGVPAWGPLKQPLPGHPRRPRP